MASSQEPTFLGLLNALAVAETAAEPLLLTWAGTTKDKRLAKTLRFVAMREGEHGKAFAKRMLELGYEVRWPDTSSSEKALLTAASASKTDPQKFRAFKLGKPSPKVDVFDSMFMDKTIDPITGGLLGRYIAEERDSTRLLAVEYDRLRAKEQAARVRALSK
jgi:hypothetical protein